MSSDLPTISKIGSGWSWNRSRTRMSYRYHSGVRGRPRFFRETDVKTNCDACGVFFDLLKGGVCERCKHILCDRHLNGSWTHRLIADVTNRHICVQCRHGG
jgi:hypothetical protein